MGHIRDRFGGRFLVAGRDHRSSVTGVGHGPDRSEEPAAGSATESATANSTTYLSTTILGGVGFQPAQRPLAFGAARRAGCPSHHGLQRQGQRRRQRQRRGLVRSRVPAMVIGHGPKRCGSLGSPITGLPSRSALVAPPLRLAAQRWRAAFFVLVRPRPPPGVSTACLPAGARCSGRPFPGEPHTALCPSKLERCRHNAVYCTPAGGRLLVLRVARDSRAPGSSRKGATVGRVQVRHFAVGVGLRSAKCPTWQSSGSA
jgi:hypothetical protein